MAQEAERKPIALSIRKQVLARDNNECRKCGRKKSLQFHHIIPVAEGQIDTIENLLVLCSRCHAEWEHVVFPHAENITLVQWLSVPPALELIAMFVSPWSDDISASEAKEAIIKAYQMAREVKSFEDRE